MAHIETSYKSSSPQTNLGSSCLLSVSLADCRERILALVMKALSLSPIFNEKHFVARVSGVKRFVHAHSLVYRMGTHVSQREPDKVAAESSDYMDLMHQIVEGPHRDRRLIINMDGRTRQLRVC